MSEETKEMLTAETEEVIYCDLAGEAVFCEAAGDYVLPDYQPEIRKILAVRPSVLPTGRYVGGARAEFNGSVLHHVLYSDSEGKLASAALPADYSFAVPLPDDRPVSLSADSMAETCICRPGGPRKLSLRTHLRSMPHVLCEEPISPEIRGMGSTADAASIERLMGELDSVYLTAGDSGEFHLSDSVRLESDGREARHIWAGGSLLVSECRAQEGACLVRGEAWVRCILSDGAGSPYTVRTKIPFEQAVVVEGMTPAMQALAYGRVSAVDVSIMPGEEGSMGALTFDVSAELEVNAAEARTVHPTLDIYSTAYEMSCRHRTLHGARLVGSTIGNYTVGGARGKAECEAESACTVVDADGRMEIVAVAVEHGRAVVSGNLLTQVIFTAAGAEGAPSSLFAAEIPVPFRIETDLRIPNGCTPHFDCHGELISARGRIEQNAVAVDAEITLALRATEACELRALAEAEPDRDAAVAHRGDRVLVCYPRDDDTLWSIAARYHCSRAALIAQNGLPEEALALSNSPISIDGVHHLLINR